MINKETCMFNNKNIHFIGIGGVSMSGIAQILNSSGATITGYDMQSSIFTEKLETLGIKVFYEPNLKAIDEADIVVYTAAIHEDNEELSYAKKMNKEIDERIRKCYLYKWDTWQKYNNWHDKYHFRKM